jgi:CBS domain containing-hemolysin-like protein
MPFLLLCILLISCSFILSSSEIAIFSLSRVQLKQIKDQSEPLFRRIRALIQDSMGLLITVLLCNEIVNISLASLITSRLIEPLSLPWREATVLGVFVTTPVILILCELTPKIIAARANQMIISMFLPFLYALYWVMKPVISIIRFFLPKQQQLKELHKLHEEDFMVLAEEQAETGHLHETELELIKNVFEMDDTRVEQMATPIKKIFTLPEHFTLEQAYQAVLKEKDFSKIPVMSGNQDEVIGVLSAKDLIEIKIDPESRKENISRFVSEPLVVSGAISMDALFRKMKAKKVQVAFIKNLQGKVTGMITLQDILDALIEEAFEE